MPSGANLEYFLSVVKGHSAKVTEIIEVCVPDSYAIQGNNIEKINRDRCYGCFNCIDIGEIEYITPQGIPSLYKDGNILLSTICNHCFKGDYVTFGPASKKLSNHTKKDETRITNPLAALYLWRLSANPSNILFCSSPNGEVSLSTTNPLDQREGHLDVVVSPTEKKVICVFEGKSSLDSLLRDIIRDQWNRYNDNLHQVADDTGFMLFFSYVIGGEELGLYPTSDKIPHHNRRNEFYQFISENNKRFISIHSLRTLRACQICLDPTWNWEEWFSELFSNENFVGLLSGGIVMRKDDIYYLQKAPWI